MGIVKRIVCLANSRKLGERCIAGKLFETDSPTDWLRPVSRSVNGEVSPRERLCSDGTEPGLMDLLDIVLLGEQPHGYQKENWLFDSTQRWHKCGKIPRRWLARLVDPVAPLWVDGHHTGNGRNDMIPLELAQPLDSSLRLIHVDRLTLKVFTSEWNGIAKRKVQGQFTHASSEYWLSITDPVCERVYKPRPDGTYDLGACFLTISLSEPLVERNACYKLIAAIIDDAEGCVR